MERHTRRDCAVERLVQRCALERYDAGSWGPRTADALIETDGRRWRLPDPRKKA